MLPRPGQKRKPLLGNMFLVAPLEFQFRSRHIPPLHRHSVIVSGSDPCAITATSVVESARAPSLTKCVPTYPAVAAIQPTYVRGIKTPLLPHPLVPSLLHHSTHKHVPCTHNVLLSRPSSPVWAPSLHRASNPHQFQVKPTDPAPVRVSNSQTSKAWEGGVRREALCRR